VVPDIGVRVSFLGQKPANAGTQQPLKGVLVPAQAIAQRDGGTVVFVVVEGRAVQRPVTPAAQDVGTMKLVPQGVNAGDQLVLAPPATLRDGASVRVKEESR